MDRRFQNFLQYGQFGNGYRLEQGLLWGQFWTRRSGCYLVFRGEGAVWNIDYARIECAAAGKGVFAIPRILTHEAGKTYYYAIRRVSETGKQERNATAIVCLSLDEEGRRRVAQPNAISGLRARQIGVQRVLLSWWYNPLGQESRCEYFFLYQDNGDWGVNYHQAAAEIEYRGGGYYRCELEMGTKIRHRFGICAVSPTGQRGATSEIGLEMKVTGLNSLTGMRIQPGL